MKALKAMHKAKKIIILLHESSSLELKKLEMYRITQLAKIWRLDGLEVEFCAGIHSRPAGDICIVHVNISLVPERYLELARTYPVALNANVADIRKHSFSVNLVSAGDGYDGPVIVKSNLNYGGKPEVAHQVIPESILTEGPCAVFLKQEYRVFARRSDVPSECFSNPYVVVERFLPEQENGLYAVRCLNVCGARWTCTRMLSHSPIVDYTTRIGPSQEVTPHPDILEAQQFFSLDFGKLDYVMHDGRAVLLDVNKTTGGGRSVDWTNPASRAKMRHLAEGLYAYF